MTDGYQPGHMVGRKRYLAILDAAIERAKRGRDADVRRKGETYTELRERLGLPQYPRRGMV